MKRSNPFRLFMMAACSFLLCLTAGLTNNEFKESVSALGGSETHIVKVAYFDSTNFQEGTEEGSIKSGYAYEIYQKISDYTGWSYQYIYGDWTTLYNSFLNGNIDLFAGLAYVPERYSLMEFGEKEIDSEALSLFVRKDDTRFNSGDYKLLNGKRIGVLEDSGIASIFEGWYKKEGLTPVIVKYNEINNFQPDLDSGKIDAFVTPESSVSIDSNASIFANFSNRDMYICARKGATDLINDVNMSMESILKDDPNFFADLKRKYFSNSIGNASLNAEELEWINVHKVLRIGYEKDYLPFSDEGPDGNPTGVVTDIVDSWLDGLKLKDKLQIEYKGYKDYDDMFVALGNGSIDTVFPIVDNMWFSEERAIMCASKLVSSSIVAIYKGTFTEESLKSISYSSHSAIQEICANIYYPDAKKVVCSSRDECLNAVMSGKVGCTLFNATRAEMAVRENAYNSLSIMPLGKTVDYSFAVRKGDRVLLSLLNKGISITNTSDFTNKLFNYVNLSTSYDFQDFIKDNFLLVIIIIVLIALAFSTMQIVHSRKLTKALNEVKKANEVKTNFFFNMSHDIRTPMNAILGFTNMGLKYIDDKPKVEECLNKAQQSGGLLLSLINNVLDISRIESNKAIVEENPGDAYLAFETIESTMKELAAAKEVEVNFKVTDIIDRYVYADFNKCIRIFTNLISNAIKYNNPGGKVNVCCKQIKANTDGYGVYQFIVEDNGVGMSKEFQQHMYRTIHHWNPAQSD